MLDKLLSVESKYNELLTLLGDATVQADQSQYRTHAKAVAEIEPVVEKFRDYKAVISEITQAEELAASDDAEMQALAQEELPGLKARADALMGEIKILLIPKDPNDEKDVVLEIRAGTGGDEAALFSADLFRMYSRYADLQGWKSEILSENAIGIGGYKEIIFQIKGKGAYSKLKYESGVHRVQRVPSTESSGRIHTSTSTVAVLAEVDDVEVDVPESDVEVEVFKAGGAGGQNVQKNSTAIRLTHKPTGMVVICQDERSQLQNKLRAMSILRARLYEQMEEKRRSEEEADRRSQVGTGERSEKIRTYNFPQNRVTDHRIGVSSYNLPGVLAGNIDQFIEELSTRDEAGRLAASGVDDEDE